MRAVSFGRSCLFVIVSGLSPALAEDIAELPVPTASVPAAPTSVPQALVAATAAQTLQAIADMRAQLAQLVPMAPRTDSIAQAASEFTAHWGSVIDSYAETQLQAMDAMILDLNEHHQAQINDFMTQDPMVSHVSLFDDPDFLNLIDMPTNFTDLPSTDAGFFGS